MSTLKGGVNIKNDYRYAEMITECLAYGVYSAVHVPTVLNNSVKEFIRMRDDIKDNLKGIKQRIIALTTRNGKQFEGKSYWTTKHIDWLKSLPFDEPLLQETLDEYVIEYYHLVERVENLDKRIEEIAVKEVYVEKVRQLQCLIGIKTHTALSLIVETSDFKRFKKAELYSAFLGLIPGEKSSSDKERKLGITKAGNSHLRRLLVKSAQAFTRGTIGFKSKNLKEKQSKCNDKVIAYADKANERLRRKYYKMISKGKKFNVAKTAIARELACFVWGIMTDKMEFGN